MPHEDEGNASSLTVSRTVSVLLLLTYCCYIYFQLYSHSHLFSENADDDDDERQDSDDETPILGVWGSVFWLAVITIFISVLSEYMVDSLEKAATGGVPDLFLGTIVIPIVGNAAEHAAAIIFAVKNKMELSLGIAVGSAVQIALFVVPVLIILAWIEDIDLSLDFHIFETGCLLLTTILVGFMIQSGESNWLQGIILVIAYCAVSAGFFVHKDV